MLRNILAIAVASAISVSAYAASDLSQEVNQLQMQVNKLQKQANAMSKKSGSMKSSGVSVATYSPLTWQLLDNTVGTGTEMSILKARKDGNLANSTLYFGGEAKADAVYQHTNAVGEDIWPASFTDNTASNTTNNFAASSTALHLTQGALDVVGSLNNWATGYAQLGATEIGYNSSEDNISFEKAYLLLGNLNQSPVYGLVGKKEVDFGSFASVNMYTNPLNRIVYEASGNQAAVGYNQYGFNAVASVMNGGGEYYGSGSPNGINLYTPNNNQINNFAINSSYSATNNNVNWKVGAGYLNGSGIPEYNGDYLRDAAWDVNASIEVNNLTVLAEYTANTEPMYEQYIDKPHAYDIGASYAFPVLGRNSVLSADYSSLRANESDYLNGDYSQFVLGFRSEVLNNVWAGIEYAYNDGIYSSNLGNVNTYGWNGNPAYKNNTVLLDLTAMF